MTVRQGGQGRLANLLKHQCINRTFLLCNVPSAACPPPGSWQCCWDVQGLQTPQGPACLWGGSATSWGKHLFQLGSALPKYVQEVVDVKKMQGSVLPVLRQVRLGCGICFFKILFIYYLFFGDLCGDAVLRGSSCSDTRGWWPFWAEGDSGTGIRSMAQSPEMPARSDSDENKE